MLKLIYSYTQSRGSYLLSCLEKNIQPELPQDGDEKELLDKFDEYFSVSETTEKANEHKTVTIWDVHQQEIQNKRIDNNQRETH